ILGYLFFQFSLNGLAFQYLWPQFPTWANLAIPFSILSGGALANQFTRSFLQLEKNAKRLNRIFIALIFLGGLTAITTLFLSYKIGILTAILYIFVSAIFMVTAGITTLLQKFRPARFYVYSWAAFLAGIIFYVLKTVNILPAFFLTEYAIQIGSAIQVVLLALGLADYINKLQNERKDLILDKLESRLEMMESVSRFVPERFLDFLGKKDISDISIGEATQRDMTLMFVDIRKFTTLSEHMTVEENFHFLNAYLQRMGPSIHRHRGIIDKFIGDAIMALFPDDPEDALKAAIGMMQELKIYNDHRAQSHYDALQIGIGLHYGSLMLGTVGSSDRMDTTVIGDTVNLAARIESVTKIFKAPIILSDFVYKKLADPSKYHLREIDSVRVRGKEHPVVLYEAMDYIHPEILARRIESFPS
ncbi:MAG TPA: adenylate/guanylate cyclase domain-containing protein, partial [Turneriella sp.]|nr:adenylate/guanylate cyclase domain-containing protein [Turneriella sp.]